MRKLGTKASQFRGGSYLGNKGPLFGVALLFCLPLVAQSINCGGPATGAYVADEFFAGGATWGPSNDPAMGTVSGPYQTLRYGTSFTYTLPVATPGLVGVQVLMMEPNKTGPGQRLFTVTANGWQSATLDLYSLTGGKFLPYEVDFWFTAQSQVTLSFRASVGNAVVSAIIMYPAPAAAPVAGGPCTNTNGSLAVLVMLPDGSCLPVEIVGNTLAGVVDSTSKIIGIVFQPAVPSGIVPEILPSVSLVPTQ